MKEMSAREYLEKALEICGAYELLDGTCPECPLHPFGCGVADKRSDISKAIKIVSEWEPPQIERCPTCGAEVTP